MPSVRQFNKSNYLKKEDCDPDILLTIQRSEAKNMAWQGEPEDMKWVLYFKEAMKGFVVSNLINQDSLIEIMGTDDLNKWVGKKIVLYVNPDIEHKGKRVGGIRVRAPKNQVPPNEQPPATQPSGPNSDWVGENPPPPTDEVPF